MEPKASGRDAGDSDSVNMGSRFRRSRVQTGVGAHGESPVCGSGLSVADESEGSEVLYGARI
ncbi:hypothetical protein GSI01S_05_01360 [Gordonia sihwensis NBRC 108236]|uniref:Uncharacterized protein n=1 Tax=Gordonia sihwensis NBRC 108236 TaxID=1223544 RepID=L7LFB1_9ACTN|nr:hypothetical protein GSI01S_05_01360 [Gordonia sihwensis NBRC 108236]